MEQTYITGTVDEVLKKTSYEDGSFSQNLKLIDKDDAEYVVKYGNEFQPLERESLKNLGDKVIIVQQENQFGELTSEIADSYRLPVVFGLSILFIIIISAVGKKKGLLSIIGMILSLMVLLKFVVPQILIGANPIIISLIGSLVIGFATVYLSHGFNLKSHIALFSMMISLFAVSILSFISVQSASLFGLGSEEAAFLQLGATSNINLQGLLLGGIMLGALGVLDDITVSQTSIVFQLRMAKKTIGFRELYNRSIEVGRDHIASLVNTLVLAYIGANMPLLVLFTINESVPSWVMLNSEMIVEEIIRTLAGSIGLVLAVPFTTIIATYFAIKLKDKDLKKFIHDGHSH